MTFQVLRRRAVLFVHLCAAAFLVALCSIIAFQAGDWHWPYVVQSVDLAPDPVPRGGTLSILVVRTYLDTCDLAFERQIESVAQPNEAPTILPTESGVTPWQYSGKTQTVNIGIPHDFACGPAQIRTVPSAACNWLQSTFSFARQRRTPSLTPFEVSCAAPG